MTRKKKNAISLWIMLIGIIILAAAIFLLPSCGGANAAETTLVTVGEQAPDFTTEMIDGSQTTLSSLRGKVVLLNFWATWCPPCRVELKHAQQELIDRFAGRDFVFLPISRGEHRAAVEDFRHMNNYTFPMGLDPEQQIYELYATNYIPRNFLIDKQGRIVKIAIGYTAEELEEFIRNIETELKRQ